MMQPMQSPNTGDVGESHGRRRRKLSLNSLVDSQPEFDIKSELEMMFPEGVDDGFDVTDFCGEFED